MSELNGDWKKVESVIRNFDKIVYEPLVKATAKNAQMVEATLVQHIQNQALNWKPLSAAYEKYKKNKGLSNQIYIATSTLMNSITHAIRDGGLTAFIGVLRTARGPSGESEVMIGKVMEYGSAKRNIPARPLFRPTFKEMKPKIINNYKKALRAALKKAFEGLGSHG